MTYSFHPEAEIEFERLEREWQEATPRHSDAKKLCKMLNYKPLKVKTGFCAMCDSRIFDEWCWKPNYELRHIAHRSVGILRPSELKIIIEALDSGDLQYKIINHEPK